MRMKVSIPRLMLAGAAILPASAFAQIVYAPATATAVPTLSEWGMIGLSALMAFVAIQTARKGGSRVLSALLAVGALAVGMGGEQAVIRTAQAIVFQESMATEAGGTISLTGYAAGNLVTIQGHPTIPMRIVSVNPASDTTTPSSPTCAVNLIVSAAGACYYRVPGGG
ncbi:midcut-by-XrtH protein [Zoogloea sp.]|uniref:midcut-by-XrtH protein n=1 Tax=Zoogloea sp. TaxID=49181 RepID=UPI001415840C|nr:MAG: midcut-by-XrtH protein [Zoogloea sp.]